MGRCAWAPRDCGTFAGKSLKPGTDNLYRLGGGSSGGSIPPGKMACPMCRNKPVCIPLAPARSRSSMGSCRAPPAWEIGAVCRLGNGAVLFEGPNTFSGLLTVQGTDEVHEGQGWPGSLLEGLAQTQAGQAPLAEREQGAVVTARQHAAHLTGVPGAASPWQRAN